MIWNAVIVYQNEFSSFLAYKWPLTLIWWIKNDAVVITKYYSMRDYDQQNLILICIDWSHFHLIWFHVYIEIFLFYFLIEILTLTRCYYFSSFYFLFSYFFFIFIFVHFFVSAFTFVIFCSLFCCFFFCFFFYFLFFFIFILKEISQSN